jgi:alginate O-acetyltransferase complex protein AlgI
MFRAMAGFGSGDGIAQHASLFLRPEIVLILLLAAVASVPILPVLGRAFERRLPRLSQATPLRVAVAPAAVLLVFVLVGMSLTSGTHNPFIYFRF